MITVFYDGDCKLCRREITHYERLADSKKFRWVDINSSPDALKKRNISTTDALKKLHVEDKYGNIKIGVDAFITIWKNIPEWRLLATFASLPVINEITKIAYKKFAKRRFQRLKKCRGRLIKDSQK